jgi:hypothetical protein
MSSESSEFYRQYELDPSSHQLVETGEWTAGVLITGKEGAKEFSGPTTYKTREEAVKHSLLLGKQIVDGKIPGAQF